MNAAASLVGVLRDAGVGELFGLPGAHNLAIWAAAREAALPLVGVRHEQGAAYAADGAARVTGRLGVAVTTTGPGAANALGATGEAWASGSPVLVIATDIPSTLRRPGVYRGALHETTDQAAMFRPVTKEVFVARSAEEVPRLAQLAVECAGSAPQGPAYLEVPTDLLVDPLPAAYLPPLPATSAAPAAAPAAEVVAAAAGSLRGSRRPLIWAGGGAVGAGAGPEVAELATLLGAPVLETYQGRGILPLDHPSKVTVSLHDPEVGPLWDEADAVLAIGTDFDGMTTQNWLLPRPPTLVAINLDGADADKNYPSDLLIEADAKLGAAALLKALRALPPHAPGGGEYLAEAADRQRRAYEAVRASDPGAATLLETLAALPAEVPVFADMCIPGYWTAAYLPIGRPRKLAYPVGWGTLGFAFPAGFGAAIATRKPTLCIAGDGGFLLAAGELAAVAQERAPLTVLLVDDGGYGMLRFDQAAVGGEPTGTDLLSPDFVALAASFGVPARRVEGLGASLGEALAEALGSGGPQLIVTNAALSPPPSTSPRWYRRPAAPSDHPCGSPRVTPVAAAGARSGDGPPPIPSGDDLSGFLDPPPPSGITTEELADRLRPLLRLPIERVLAFRGEPVLRDGAGALERALGRGAQGPCAAPEDSARGRVAERSRPAELRGPRPPGPTAR